MEKEQFSTAVSSLLKGMDGFLSSKTVVGNAVEFGDGTIAVPLMDVSFAIGAGAFINGSKSKDNAAGALGGKMTPTAVLIIQDGNARIVNVSNQDTLSKIVELVPEVLDKIKLPKKAKEDLKNKAEEAVKAQETEE